VLNLNRQGSIEVASHRSRSHSKIIVNVEHKTSRKCENRWSELVQAHHLLLTEILTVPSQVSSDFETRNRLSIGSGLFFFSLFAMSSSTSDIGYQMAEGAMLTGLSFGKEPGYPATWWDVFSPVLVSLVRLPINFSFDLRALRCFGCIRCSTSSP
jgi:hypothetical protein